MLQAFIDESFDHGLFVMAGFVAPAEAWARFSDEWQQFLEMKPGVRYLKMNDAMTLEGEFRWWRDAARDEKLRLLNGCISDHATIAVSCSMPHSAYVNCIGDIRTVPKWSPYQFLLFGIIKELVHHQALLGLHEKIDFIFDEQVMEKEKIRREWEAFKSANWEIEQWLGDAPQFRDDLICKPLQAADMLAWLMRNKGVAGIEFPSKPPRTKDCPIISFVWTEESLRDLARKMSEVQPYLTGTWGKWIFASFFEESGRSFSTVASQETIDRYWKKLEGK
jgi:hypothetical protein